VTCHFTCTLDVQFYTVVNICLLFHVGGDLKLFTAVFQALVLWCSFLLLFNKAMFFFFFFFSVMLEQEVSKLEGDEKAEIADAVKSEERKEAAPST
jgi:hypothetical protein